MTDSYGREISYMRISVTDRCNLRCKYCMPKGIQKIPMCEILTYEEILRICKAAVELGIGHFRVVGGEPLARLGVCDLVARLKSLPGAQSVTMTTNGVQLADHLPARLSAGIDGINVSLDSLDRETYRSITGVDALDRVMNSIEAVRDAGLPLKINCVLQRDVNEDEGEAFIDLAMKESLDVRFIELMPIGPADPARGVAGGSIINKALKRYPEMKEDHTPRGTGPAEYWSVPGRRGSIGFISAITDRFCESCNRIRLTSTGCIRPCLCYPDEFSLKEALSGGDEGLKNALAEAILAKPEKHCFDMRNACVEYRSMSMIGG